MHALLFKELAGCFLSFPISVLIVDENEKCHLQFILTQATCVMSVVSSLCFLILWSLGIMVIHVSFNAMIMCIIVLFAVVILFAWLYLLDDDANDSHQVMLIQLLFACVANAGFLFLIKTNRIESTRLKYMYLTAVVVILTLLIESIFESDYSVPVVTEGHRIEEAVTTVEDHFNMDVSLYGHGDDESLSGVESINQSDNNHTIIGSSNSSHSNENESVNNSKNYIKNYINFSSVSNTYFPLKAFPVGVLYREESTKDSVGNFKAYCDFFNPESPGSSFEDSIGS